MKKPEAQSNLSAETIFQADKFLGRIRTASLFVMLTVLCFSYFASALFNGTELILCFIPYFLFFILSFVWVIKLRKGVKPRISLYEDAAEYMEYIKQKWCFYRSPGFFSPYFWAPRRIDWVKWD